MALFHRQYQLNSPLLFLRFDHQNEVPGTWYLVLFSPLRRGSKKADLILLCDVNRLLATDWPESDATGRVMMSATSEPDTRHPAPLNTSISVQSTIVIDY